MKIHIALQDSILLTDETSDSQAAIDIPMLKAYAQRIAKEIAKLKGTTLGDISIVFVSKTKIKKMNAMYRHLDKPTDVLSFASEEADYLGDIILCIDTIQHYAKKFGCSLKEEIQRDILHGMLHLVGYDHVGNLHEGSDEEMFLIQEDLLKRFI